MIQKKMMVRLPRSRVYSMVLEGLEVRQLLSISPLSIVNYDGVDNGSTLANALLVPSTGITITGTSYVGSSGQAGTYSGFALNDGTTQLGISDGVLLTSGTAAGAQAGTPFGTDLSQPGDSDLTTLLGSTTFDANSVNINFTTTMATKSVRFDLVFGSEEYPGFVNSQYNDAFSAYLDGVRISFDSNNDPITINSNYLLLNNSGSTIPGTTDRAGTVAVNFGSDLEYGGLTPKLTTQAPLIGTGTHTLKLVIADDADGTYDSGAFIANLRGSTTVVGSPNTDSTGPNLAPSAVTAPAAAYVGDTVPVSWTVGNIGDVDTAGTWTDKVYWHRTDVSQADQLLDTVSYSGANLTAGTGTYTVSKSYAAPTTAGTYELMVVTGNGETMTEDTSNNSLSATATTVSTLTVGAGGPYTIVKGAGLTLAGTGPASGVTYSWDLNNDSTFGDATGLTPTLTAGALTTLGITSAGNYSITLKGTSDNGAVATSALGTLHITEADLHTTSVTAPASSSTGQSVHVSWGVTDSGNADALGSWSDKVYYHLVGGSGPDILVATVLHTGGLTIGSSYTGGTDYVVPNNAGNYTFVVVADAAHVVQDVNLANNTASSSTMTVTADLTLTLAGLARGQAIGAVAVPSEDDITLTGTAKYSDDLSTAVSASLLIRVSTGGSNSDVSVMTDSQGNFTLTLDHGDLVAGDYVITARAAGMAPTNIPDAATVRFTRLATPAGNLSADDTYIWRVYEDALHRTPDTAGVSYWENVLTGNQGKIQSVATGVVNSTEFRTNEIKQLYEAALKRSADTFGLNAWLTAMQGGETIEQVNAGILASAEYGALQPTNAAFVSSLYPFFLQHDGDTSGIQYWSNKLTQGTTRDQVAMSFQQTTECTQLTVQRIYQSDLNRVPATGDMTYWSQKISQGEGYADVLAGILGSMEYFQL